MPGGSNVCMNYELNLLLHIGVVAKRLHAAAESATQERHDNTPLGPPGRGEKKLWFPWFVQK